MLEMIFGDMQTLSKVVGGLFGGIVLLPLVVAIISASITGFVTRGENTVSVLYRLTMVKPQGHDSPDVFDWIFGSMFHLALSGVTFIVGAVLGAIIWYTPVWVYILTAVIAGVLLTARFAYTLKSKFDKHLEKLHENADKDDYDVKW